MSSTPVPLPAEQIPAKRIRRSIKAPAVKTAVILGRANGKAKAQIARDLGITRPTVNAIIEESDLDRQLEAGQIQSALLIPKAINVLQDRLNKGSENAAIKTLENTIWPLSDKRKGANLAGMQLTVAIQNLLGTTTNSGSGAEKQPVNDANSQVIDNPTASKD